MDAFESAFESLDVILVDDNIFMVIEYSLIDLQMKMWHTSILVKLVKNKNPGQRRKYCEITSMFFFWNRFLVIFLEKNDYGTQNGPLTSYFGCKVNKSDF